MSKSKKSFFKNSVALAMLAGAITSGQAFAQTSADEELEEEEAIVVTGSRIRSEFTSSSPIQVITVESAQQAGVTNTGDFLQSSPLAAGSPQVDATISSAFVTDGGPGAQTVSLRGLGANRTLVLLNGRRAGPAGTRGAVSAFDLNVLPIGIVDRIEILKDGASSIYGSDAVAGVVNIITDRGLDGGQVALNLSVPQGEGGEEAGVELTWGRSFGRGHINAALSYDIQFSQELGEREFTDCGTANTYNRATGARSDVIDPRTGRFACRSNTATGLTWVFDYAYYYGEGTLGDPLAPDPGFHYIQYDGSGQIGALVPSTILPTPLNPLQFGAPSNWYQVNRGAGIGVVNTNSPFERNSDLIPNNERTTFYLEGAFDVGGGIEAYGELLMNRRETSTNGFRQVWTYLYSYNYSCSFTQYFETGGQICYEGGDPFSAGWQGMAGLSPTVTTDYGDSQQTVDYARVVAGLRGEFQGWLGPLNWDFYYQGSRSDGSYTDDRILADAVYSSEGRSDSLRGPGTADDGTLARGIIKPNSIPRPTASCVGYVTPISNRACIDVDWMSAALNNGQGFTAAEEAFLYDRETGETEYTQHYYEASITGDIFTLPAGNVGAAFGIVHREDEILDTPGEITRAGNVWGASASGITRGSDTTQEVFGELAIPILRGSSLAESLEATISGRYTDVESSGTASTYKVGLAWQITSEWLLRATQGTSFRAPALFELYLAGETSFPTQRAIDPCIGWGQALTDGDIPQRVADNCAADGIPDDYTGAGASATAFRSGGVGLLEPETSEALVLGIVWTPRFADLQVALDYFEIEVEDEVATLGAAQIVYGCYNSTSFPTDPFCLLFTRSPINLIEEVYNSFLNINSQVNRGLDLTVRYGHDFSFGNFTTQAQFTYQIEDETSLFSGTITDPNGSNGDPMFVGSIDFSLERGDWTAFWRAQLIGETDDSNFSSGGTALTRYDIEGEFTTYHSASLSREFDNFSLLFGVANIFDQEPPSVTTLGAATQSTVGPSLLASQYDYIGRRAFLRVTADF